MCSILLAQYDAVSNETVSLKQNETDIPTLSVNSQLANAVDAVNIVLPDAFPIQHTQTFDNCDLQCQGKYLCIFTNSTDISEYFTNEWKVNQYISLVMDPAILL